MFPVHLNVDSRFRTYFSELLLEIPINLFLIKFRLWAMYSLSHVTRVIRMMYIFAINNVGFLNENLVYYSESHSLS